MTRAEVSDSRPYAPCGTPPKPQHKLVAFMRALKMQPEYDPVTQHCVYGNDADQLLLALALHEPRCSVMKPNPWSDTRSEYHLIHCSVMREHIAIDMLPACTPRDATAAGSGAAGVGVRDGERAVDDFILLSLMLGTTRAVTGPRTSTYEQSLHANLCVLRGDAHHRTRQRLHPSPCVPGAVPARPKRVLGRHEPRATRVPQCVRVMGGRVHHAQRRPRRRAPA